jgi:hypothetical protein
MKFAVDGERLDTETVIAVFDDMKSFLLEARKESDRAFVVLSTAYLDTLLTSYLRIISL